MDTATETNIGQMLDDLRDVLDQTDELNGELSRLKKRRYAIEAAIREDSERTGNQQYGNDRLSVSVKEDMVASYDPALWGELIAWAVETNNQHIIQRRVSTKPVVELIDNGVELHPGIKIEPQTKLNVRRK